VEIFFSQQEIPVPCAGNSNFHSREFFFHSRKLFFHSRKFDGGGE